jgi:hypothetical protein
MKYQPTTSVVVYFAASSDAERLAVVGFVARYRGRPATPMPSIHARASPGARGHQSHRIAWIRQ